MVGFRGRRLSSGMEVTRLNFLFSCSLARLTSFTLLPCKLLRRAVLPPSPVFFITGHPRRHSYDHVKLAVVDAAFNKGLGRTTI